MQTACQEYTQPRNLKTSRPRRWIRSNTKMGSVLDVKIYLHEGRYCIDIMIDSLFKDQTVSWVRIVHGINKYVTETSEEIPIENVELFISTGRLVAKAQPRPKLVVNLSSNYVPSRERKWIDINPPTFSQSCFAVSNSWSDYCDMTRTFLEKPMEQYDMTILMQNSRYSWCLGKFPGKRERREENISILLESLFIQWNLVRPGNSRTFRRKFRWSIIARQYSHRMTSPSTSARCTPLLKVDWSREEKAIEGIGSQCSLRQWIRQTLNLIREKLYTIWTNPESHCTNTLSFKYTTIDL